MGNSSSVADFALNMTNDIRWNMRNWIWNTGDVRWHNPGCQKESEEIILDKNTASLRLTRCQWGLMHGFNLLILNLGTPEQIIDGGVFFKGERVSVDTKEAAEFFLKYYYKGLPQTTMVATEVSITVRTARSSTGAISPDPNTNIETSEGGGSACHVLPQQVLSSEPTFSTLKQS